MEFLKALKEARGLGLTNDEFLDIWKYERGIKDLQENRAQKTLETTSQGCLGGEDRHVGENVHFMDQGESDTENELQVQFQQMYNQIQDRQAILVKELENRQTEMREEFSRHFEILTKHISNCADSQTIHLKRFLTQELELMQREIGTKIDRLMSCSGAADGDTGVGLRPGQRLEQRQKQEHVEQQRQRQEQPVQQERQPKLEPHQNIQGQQPRQANDEHEIKRQHCHEQQQQQRYQQQPSMWTTQRSESSVSTASASSERKCPHIQTATQETSQVSGPVQGAGNKQTSAQPQPAISLTSQSVPATGRYAEAVARLAQEEVKQSAGKSGSRTIWTSGESLSPSTVCGQENSSSSLKSMSSNGDVFTIHDCDSFSQSGNAYTTDFFQRSWKLSKIKVRVFFDSKWKLQIHLHVSRGEMARNVTRAFVFNSFGYIYHTGSKEYTKIWLLKNHKRQLPSDEQEEVILKPEICLWTVRGAHTDVTYRKLKEREYTGDNSLKFKWFFSDQQV